ncbi:MAG: bifunctional [glutamine synthetase] adenylyltransferase/[glutamine synthetase]-adenylyl-L-tyrosine phosphorylase [Parvularculaceae bacterium]
MRDQIGARLDVLPPEARRLIYSVGGCSPYLFRLITSAPEFACDVLAAAPETAIDEAIAATWRSAAADDAAAQKAALRAAKRRAALVVALSDIGGVWNLNEATGFLADFADAAVGAALRGALLRLIGKGFAPPPTDAPEKECGIAVIAMGKLGARELNYSSDIDLIVVFDPEKTPVSDDGDAREVSVRAARETVDILQDQTADGYVFRTDLRLRPDPGVSAAAVSVRAAEAYYEAHGQNWERAAFIKARAAAGDRAVGATFLETLRPFVWRKYLDYAAIEDIHSIKRQIHAAKGGGGIEFYGHDLKLGRGGIREIEFFVQTQQLILGGKNPALRAPATLDALDALAQSGHVTQKDACALEDAYLYMRRVEHRIQMLNDEQTHRIPRIREDADRLAAFLGEKDEAAFRKKLISVLSATHRRFSGLFESEDRLSSEDGNLSFTGVENDPATVRTLETLGFARASEISIVIRRWHAGAPRATRSLRARELLTKLTPTLLESLARASDADAAFFAFDRFLMGLPSGVQIFSLFANNPQVFDTLIEIITTSPFLTCELSKRANFVEALVESAWPAPPPEPKTAAKALDDAVAAAHGFEAKLNTARRWGGEQRFQTAAQLAAGSLAPDEAARAFTAVADAAITAFLPTAQEEMRRLHGAIEGGLVVIGLGRLGAREMTATSDIDLIFIYDTPEGAVSDGAKALDGVSYFTRLVRRLVTALSAATEEGALFEVDMQLRPSGAAGPAAVSFSAFQRYYDEEAWTWEEMALAKARVVAGDEALAEKVVKEIETIFRRPRNIEALARDVIDMRARITEAKPPASVWDVKLARGGRTDIDFLWQFLWLAGGDRLGAPPLSAAAAIDRLREAGGLKPKAVQTLLTALELFENIIQSSRALLGGVFDPCEAGDALQARMAAVCGAATIERAERVIARRQAEVARLFDDTIKVRQKTGSKPDSSSGANVDI